MAQDMNVGIRIDVLSKDAQSRLNSFAGATKQQFESIRAAGMNLAMVGGAITGFFAAATKETFEADKASKKLEIQFGANAKALAEYANVVQQHTRFNDDLVKQAMAIGGTYEGLRDNMVQATNSALNLSEAMNIDVISAMHMLGKASGGMVVGLRRVGIMVDQNDFKMRGMAAVYDEVAKETKNAAFVIDDASKAYDQAKNAAGDFMEAVGYAVGPLIGSAAKQIKSLAEWLQKVAETNSGRAILQIVASLGAFITVAGTIIMIVGQLGISLIGLKLGWASVAGTAKAAWIAMTGPIGVVVAGLALVAGAVMLITRRKRELANITRDAADAAKVEAEAMSGQDIARRVKALNEDIAARKQLLEEARQQAKEAGTGLRGRPGALLGASPEGKAAEAEAKKQQNEIAKLTGQVDGLTDAFADNINIARIAGGAVSDSAKQSEQAIEAAKEASNEYTESLRGQATAADNLASAQKDLQSAVDAQANSVADAQKRVIDADAGVVDAVKQAVRGVIDAKREETEARQEAARNAEDAARSIRDAEEGLTRAIRDADTARRDMRERESEQIKELARLQNDATNGVAEAQKSAADKLASAERALAEERYRRYKDQMIEQYGEPMRKQFEAYEQSKRLADLEAAVDAAKAEGAAAVADAKAKADEKARELEAQRMKTLEDNANREQDLLISVRNAQEALQDARTRASEQAAQDQQRILDAEIAYQDAIVAGRKSILEAIQERADAIRNLAETQKAANERIAQSVRGLRDAQIALAGANRAVEQSYKDLAKAQDTAAAGNAQAQVRSKRDTRGVVVPRESQPIVTVNIGGNVYGDKELQDKIAQGVQQGMQRAALAG